MSYTPTSDNQIFIQTSDKVVVNTAAETSALGIGVGTKMVKSDNIKPGSRIRIHGEGVYSSPLLLGSATIRVKLGGTTVASVTTSTLGISGLLNASNKSFTFDCIIVFRTTGVSGTVVAGGAASYSGAPGTKIFDDLDNAGAEIAVNTSVDMSVDVTITWDSASFSRAIKTTIATITLV